MDNVLFIHIPKTAGLSLAAVLSEGGLDNWNRQHSLMHHDPLWLLQKNNTIGEKCFIFSVVRNPFTRTFSLYKYYVRMMEGFSVNKTDSLMSFEFFLDSIKTKKNIFFTNIVPSTQSYYLKDKNNNMALNKIYRFENLKELEKDLNITLPKINIGKYSTEDYKNAYTKENISLVQEIYYEDFINFNYALDSY